ncbi:hypothetical protein [Streptomyces alfalfae]|uniref:Uncharacterized protein n=1 Tax=Streptomyces alfalfae TaxID=1642299 RepID=A0A7T4TYM8_9ACTN|nr:hypothetical protein [Streptomyces alfalfae]QQC89868.1 hypothetical protein I8755_16675 [Streptomyces alfalfae]
MSAPTTHDPLVVNTKDGTCWVRRGVTSDGRGLYAVEGACACPEFLMATLAEIAETGIVGSADVLPMPAGPAADPLIVDRFDTATEPAPEDEPVLIVGAIAADGQPVALLFDAEARAKVAAWLTPQADSASSRQRRLDQLLDSIRTHGGPWTTSRVMGMRHRRGGHPQRGTARADLAELARRGHLVAHGSADRRSYTLARKDGRS